MFVKQRECVSLLNKTTSVSHRGTSVSVKCNINKIKLICLLITFDDGHVTTTWHDQKFESDVTISLFP